MTAEQRTSVASGRPRSRLDRLAPRLLVAVSAIAVTAIAVIAVASLVGADRGLSSAQQAYRETVAADVTAMVAQAYIDAGGWEGIDLAAATATAAEAGARLIARPAGTSATADGQGMGPGMGMGSGNGAGSGMGTGAVTTDVVVDGTVVGTARLVFGGGPATTARNVMWLWIAVATLIAIAMAIAAAWWVSRRISAPLVALTASTQAFGEGQRDVRADTGGPGEIGDLARSFNAMADQVSAGEEARRRMAADVAHELRTPLAVLQAHLEEARDGLAEPTPEVLAALHDQVLRLGRIVDDLGTLASAETQANQAAVHARPTDLVALARSTVTAHRAALVAAGIDVTTVAEGVVVVRADPDRVGQALTNLLANAARYCREGDRVRVTVDRDAAGGGRIEVADTGPGIPEAELPLVFDRFYRGAGTSAVPGSGLGLPVVRALVQAQGGTVAIRSAVGEGTVVTITLPGGAPGG